MILNSTPIDGSNRLINGNGEVYRLKVDGGTQWYVLTFISDEFGFQTTTPLQPNQTEDLIVTQGEDTYAYYNDELIVLSDGERSYAIVVEGAIITAIIEIETE